MRVVDVLVRTDPGLDRARTAANAAVSLAGAIVAVMLLASLTGATGPQLLTGVVIAVLTSITGSSALVSAPPSRVLVRGAALWLTASVAITLALLAASASTPVHLVATVAASAVAVWVRRFGQAAGLGGVMGWLAFVVSGVLAAPPALALALSGDVAVAYLWLVVSASLFRPSPERVLRLSLRSVLVGGRVVAGRGRRVLLSEASARSVTSMAAMVRARDDVTQAALTADAQLSPPSEDTADDTAGTDAGRPGDQARARLIDLHLAVDEMGNATAALARSAP